MMRPFSLSLLAAVLAGCAGQNPGINPTGGDAFTLEVQSLSGTAAVESGLAQAQTYCGEHGRLFVMTGSQVGSSSYRLEFRCITPGNVPPPPPQVVASAPPAAPARAARGRAGTRAPAPEDARSGPALPFGANLPPLNPAVTAPAPWQPANANILPGFPPLTATPLFAPPPGLAMAASAPNGRRLPPADNAPMELLPRLGADGVPVASASPTAQAMPAVMRQDAPQALASPPLAGIQPAAIQQAPLPPIQAQPLPAPTLPLSVPPPSFGQVVPSPNPLPGAPSSLPPIAGGSSRPVTLPGSGSPSGFSAGHTGFTQGFR